ncbi:hypothetical protein HMPREF1987_02332 [Peptostreptococcaceae bacterium oral taxon 113 str. W5053]|nr:hypothetical protein HMPREF1987_02332 [Peptostreptococcaceae bacterium oral taxon 113 str. W5053]
MRRSFLCGMILEREYFRERGYVLKSFTLMSTGEVEFSFIR